MRFSTLPFLFCAVSLAAQPTLDNSVSTPAGTQSSFFQIQAQSLMSAGTGANQTWDFSSVDTTNGQIIPQNFVSPSGLPGASNYPTANAAINFQGNVQYFLVNNQKIDLLGMYSSASQMVYSDPEERFRFPLTFNQAYTDNFAATDQGPTGIVRSGDLTNTFVGYGTLTLPDGQVFNNAIRMDQQYNLDDEYNVGGNTLTISSTITTQYYLVLGIPGPVFAAIEGSSQGQTSYSYLFQRNAVMSTEEIQDIPAVVFPNPSNEVCQVLFTAPQSGAYAMELIDLQGKVLKRLSGEAMSGEAILQRWELTDVPAGVYQIQMSQGQLRSQYKIVVQ